MRHVNDDGPCSNCSSKSCERCQINLALSTPYTADLTEKPLMAWDPEGEYLQNFDQDQPLSEVELLRELF